MTTPTTPKPIDIPLVLSKALMEAMRVRQVQILRTVDDALIARLGSDAEVKKIDDRFVYEQGLVMLMTEAIVNVDHALRGCWGKDGESKLSALVYEALAKAVLARAPAAAPEAPRPYMTVVAGREVTCCGAEYAYAGGWVGNGPAPKNRVARCSRPMGHEGPHSGEEKT